MIVSAFRVLLEELSKLMYVKCLAELAHLTLLLDVHREPVFLSVRWKGVLADFSPHCGLEENDMKVREALTSLGAKSSRTL